VVYENWNYEINVWQVGLARQGEQVERVGQVAQASAVTRTSELWNLYPQVSPDGTQLAYVSTQSGAHELWIAKRDGGDARQMTHLGRGVVKTPRWSADGRRIVYLARGQGAVDVQVMDVATGMVTPLTASPASEVAPSWSHDGTRVVFGAADTAGRWNVWSVAASGAERAPRLEIANAVAAQPSADGEWLYFTRPDQPGLWRTSAHDTATATNVVDGISIGNTMGWEVTTAGIYYLEDRDEAVRLKLAPLAGGSATERATLEQFTWPGFSVTPDGAQVLYAKWDRRDSNLMSIEY
jgi:Tol biopolymer transport system component